VLGFFTVDRMRISGFEGSFMMFKSLLKKSWVIFAMPVLASAAFNYWNPLDTSTVPKTISKTGLFINNSVGAKPYYKKTLDTNAFHFEVNSALWSDDAHKRRWIMLKDRNRANGKGSIQYEEKNDYWTYPDSAVVIKNFALDTVVGDTNTRVLWETRFLVNKKDTIDAAKGIYMDQWYGYSYKWRADQSDADLVDATGKDDTIRVWPNGKGPGKTSVMKKWHFPGRNQCDQCHRVSYADTLHGRSVLGFFTAQLNRPREEDASINQLEYFFNKKVLTGTKSNWNAATTPHWRGIDDSTASVDVRARSYIAANCSGCHGRRGIETGATFGVDLNYDFHTMEAKMEFRHRSVSWPFGLDTVAPPGMPKYDANANTKYYYPATDLGNNPKGRTDVEIIPALVVPGYPSKSVILFRQTERNTNPAPDFDPKRNQMPPLGSFEVNIPATTLIEKWIKEMPAIPAPNAIVPIRGFARTLVKSPSIEGNRLVLPPELAGPGQIRVTLTGITGRTLELKQTSRTTYAIPTGLTRGVYVIKVGNQSFTRYLF
jgi:hypothetical protein